MKILLALLIMFNVTCTFGQFTRENREKFAGLIKEKMQDTATRESVYDCMKQAFPSDDIEKIKARVDMLDKDNKTLELFVVEDLRKKQVRTKGEMWGYFVDVFNDGRTADNLSEYFFKRYSKEINYPQQQEQQPVEQNLDTTQTITGEEKVLPRFPTGATGWMQYLQENLDTDVPVRNKAKRGIYKVRVQFLIDSTGKIKEPVAIYDPGYGCGEEVIRVITEGPDWIPAILNGKRVNFRMKQTLAFSVQ